MPQVPTYDTPQVSSQALPGFRQSSVASPQLFAAGAEEQKAMGRSMLQAGDQLGAVAAKIQEKENADSIFRAETALKDDYLKFEQSVRERKGQNAWGVTTEAEKWFEDQVKKHSENLTNDVQKRYFTQSATKLRQSAMGSIATHESNERSRSLEESASATIVTSINQAASFAADGKVDAIPSVKSDVQKRVQVLAQLNGWSPERKQAEEEKHLTNLHQQVIQSLSVNDPKGAKAYYEANKAEINGSARDGIERVVKEGALRETAQTAADDIMAKNLPLDKALSEVRGKYSGDEEDEIARRIKERYSEAESAKALAVKQNADTAWKAITSGGGRKSIRPEVWNALPGEEQRQILDYLDAKYRRSQAEAKRDAAANVDDIGNLAKVEDMIEAGDITDRAQLARFEPFFSKRTLNTLSTKIDKRGVIKPTEVKALFEERKGAKVNVAKMNDSERAEWMAFQDYIMTNVKETKRPEDVDTWADRWFLKGYGKNDSFFTNDPDTYGEARVKGRKDFVIATPDAVKPNVDEALTILQRNGVAMPKDKTLGRDEFYTKNVLEAERWFGAHGAQSTPAGVAAYTLLKQNKKPITPANLDYVMRQLK